VHTFGECREVLRASVMADASSIQQEDVGVVELEIAKVGDDVAGSSQSAKVIVSDV